MDESGSESGGVVSPIPVTEGVEGSGYESVSMLDPPNFLGRFFFSGCGSGCLLVAVALGLGRAALGVRFLWPVVSRSSFFSVGSQPGRGAKLACVEAQKKGHRP